MGQLSLEKFTNQSFNLRRLYCKTEDLTMCNHLVFNSLNYHSPNECSITSRLLASFFDKSPSATRFDTSCKACGRRACCLIREALTEKKVLRAIGRCCLSLPDPGTTLLVRNLFHREKNSSSLSHWLSWSSTGRGHSRFCLGPDLEAEGALFMLIFLAVPSTLQSSSPRPFV